MHQVLNYFLFTLVVICIGKSSAYAHTCDTIIRDSLSISGPFSVASINESDGMRNGPDYAGATAFYPIGVSQPRAAIALVPGFFGEEVDMHPWARLYASHGFVAIAIGTNSNWDLPDQRANGLLDAIETLRQENRRAASPLFGIIDTSRFGVSGWSMGGGGAQRAAVFDDRISAIVALCPWLGSAFQGFLDHDVPTLIFGGEWDPTAPPYLHSSVHYDITPGSTDKMIYEIAAGNHSVATNPTNAQGTVGQMGVSWMKRYLENDPCYCPILLDRPAQATRYETTIDCVIPECLPPSITFTDSVKVTSALLKWQGASPAEGFTLRGGLQGSSNVVELTLSGGTDSVFLAENLLPGRDYVWQVKSTCSINDAFESAWSNLTSFTTAVCPTPTRLFSSNYTGNSILLNWQAAEAAQSYTIKGRIAGQTHWPISFQIRDGRTNYFEVNGIDAESSYEWKIRNNCKGERFSGWSAIQVIQAEAKQQNPSSPKQPTVNELLIYPNPAFDRVTVQIKNSNASCDKLKLFNMNGKLIKQFAPNSDQNYHLNLDDISPGLYLFEACNQPTVRQLVTIR